MDTHGAQSACDDGPIESALIANEVLPGTAEWIARQISEAFPWDDKHSSTDFLFRLTAENGHNPPMLWLRGHNHTSTIAHINTDEDILGNAMLDFISNAR